MEKREIILTRGIQASGKSTYAEHWAKEKPTERIRINWDSLRNMFGQYWVEEREKLNNDSPSSGERTGNSPNQWRRKAWLGL